MTDQSEIKFTRINRDDVIAFINRPDERQCAYPLDSRDHSVVAVTVGDDTICIYADSTVTRTDTEYVVVRDGETTPSDRFLRLTAPVYLEMLRGKALAYQDRAATAATTWTGWADRLQQLIDDMPVLDSALPYLDAEEGDSVLRIDVGRLGTAHLEQVLTRARVAADSVAGAYGRAVRVIGAKQTEALRDLAGNLGRPDLA